MSSSQTHRLETQEIWKLQGLKSLDAQYCAFISSLPFLKTQIPKKIQKEVTKPHPPRSTKTPGQAPSHSPHKKQQKTKTSQKTLPNKPPKHPKTEKHPKQLSQTAPPLPKPQCDETARRRTLLGSLLPAPLREGGEEPGLTDVVLGKRKSAPGPFSAPGVWKRRFGSFLPLMNLFLKRKRLGDSRSMTRRRSSSRKEIVVALVFQ